MISERLWIQEGGSTGCNSSTYLRTAVTTTTMTTIIMTTHDIDSVPEFADFCYVLRPGGEIALKGSPADVFASADAIAASNSKVPPVKPK